MQIDYMREFLVLEKTRSFSEAARLLHISQSALSKHIAALEDELDMDLFKRLGKSLQLTEAGTVFRDGATIIVNDSNNLAKRMKAIRSRIDAVIEIGYLPSVASFLVGPLYGWFGKHAPEVQPHVRSMEVFDLQNGLLSKTIHYAITLDFGNGDGQLSSYPIYDEEFFVAIPKTHRLASKEQIVRTDLLGEAFLIPGTEMPKLVKRFDATFGMLESYRNGTIHRDVKSVLDLVSAGYGIAIAGSHNQPYHPDILFRRLADLEEPLTVPVSLLWQTEHEQFRSIARHIAMLKAAIDDIRTTEEFARGAFPLAK